MGNQIILAPEAEQDLEEIVAYIARDNPAAAEAFGIRLLDRNEKASKLANRIFL
jgi:plasmid stabilization system protein ParE